MKRGDGADMSIIYAGCISVIVLALLGIWACTEEIINDLRSHSPLMVPNTKTNTEWLW